MAAAKLRPTASRRRVVEVLTAARRPLTLPEVLRADAELSQSSAYRNLSELMAAGVVHRIDTGEEHGHYELADDLTEHHHHLICTRCGRVLDIDLGEEMERAVESVARKLQERRQVEVTGHRIDLLGRCESCSKR